MPNTGCCVPQCPHQFDRPGSSPATRNTYHPLPDVKSRGLKHVSSSLKCRRQWLEFLQLTEDDLKAVKKPRVCSDHFRPGDFVHQTVTSGVKLTRLRPGTVPSIRRSGGCVRPPRSSVVITTRRLNFTIKLDSLRPYTTPTTPVTHRGVLSSIGSLKADPNEILHFSGLPDYAAFNCLFEHLTEGGYDRSEALNLYLSHKDQLLLTLARLRWGDLNYVADLFGLSDSVASSVFISWLNLMYSRLAGLNQWRSSDDLWSHREDSRIRSMDCIEVVCAPSIRLKALVVVDGGSRIVSCSELMDGTMTDWEVLSDTGLLDKISGKNPPIRVDNGFDRGDGSSWRLLKNVRHDDGVASKSERNYVERAIGRLRKFKLLSNVPEELFDYVDQIFRVCCMVTRFMPPIHQ